MTLDTWLRTLSQERLTSCLKSLKRPFSAIKNYELLDLLSLTFELSLYWQMRKLSEGSCSYTADVQTWCPLPQSAWLDKRLKIGSEIIFIRNFIGFVAFTNSPRLPYRSQNLWNSSLLLEMSSRISVPGRIATVKKISFMNFCWALHSSVSGLVSWQGVCLHKMDGRSSDIHAHGNVVAHVYKITQL